MRYKQQDVDCILAFSGGMDATAVLQYLLDHGRKPYIFRHQHESNPAINRIVQRASDAVMKYYDVKVVNWQSSVQANDHGWPDRRRANEHYEKIKLSPPSLVRWSTSAMFANYNMPWIEEIYWGMCYGGMLERGDGKGDKLFDIVDGKMKRIPAYKGPMDKSNYDDRHAKLFGGYLEWLGHSNIKSNYIAPLGHYSKLELYKMLPNNIKGSMVTCIKYGSTNYTDECGECWKCRDLERVRRAYAEGL